MGRSLLRDRNVNPARQQYHPYVNRPSTCQRIFEIACFLLILASVPAWLGGVYSIFVTGYGTALGLLGLLSFGTRRHTLSFLVFSILFFIFVIVVIILNAIDPIGKNIPFYDNFDAPANAGNGAALAKRSFEKRTDNSYCSVLGNCRLDIENLGQLDDGQIRYSYGQGAGEVSFHLLEGVLYDNLNRTCYISSQTQLQCNYAAQTEDYKQYCASKGLLTYAGSSEWWECNAGTGGSNVYTTKYYPQCTPINLVISTNNCTNMTTGAAYDGNAATGGAFLSGGNQLNGTNSTNNSNAAFIAVPGGAFVGSRVYAYIDSGIILALTLLAIIAGFFVAGEFRPAPGTLTHASTTSTTTAPMGTTYVPAAAAPLAAAAAAPIVANGGAVPFAAPVAVAGPSYGLPAMATGPATVTGTSVVPTVIAPAAAAPLAAAAAAPVVANGGAAPFAAPVAVAGPSYGLPAMATGPATVTGTGVVPTVVAPAAAAGGAAVVAGRNVYADGYGTDAEFNQRTPLIGESATPVMTPDGVYTPNSTRM